MRICIAGAGVVGFHLAQQLSEEGHDVTLVEPRASQARQAMEHLDVMVMTGDATHPSVLEKAEIRRADMFVAVTSSDAENILACRLAHEFGVLRKVARLRNEELMRPGSVVSPADLFIDRVVNPERELVDSIVKLLETPGANAVAEFAEGEILLRGFSVAEDVPIAGRRLADLKELADTDNFLIAAIWRDDELRIPRGEDVVQPGDHIFVLVSRETLRFFLAMVNKRIDEVQRLVIYSGSFSGTRLAQTIEKDFQVTLVEPDEELAEQAAKELERTTVLQGEATDPDLLREAGIAHADFFLALSERDDANLLAALLARKLGAKRIVVLTTEPAYVPVLDSIEIDVVLNKRLITSSAILEHIRRGRVRHVVKLEDGEAELIELETVSKSKVVGRPLKEVDFPRGAIVGAIVRDGVMIIPKGDSVIHPGERVVVVALPEAIQRVEKAFAAKRLFR